MTAIIVTIILALAVIIIFKINRENEIERFKNERRKMPTMDRFKDNEEDRKARPEIYAGLVDIINNDSLTLTRRIKLADKYIDRHKIDNLLIPEYMELSNKRHAELMASVEALGSVYPEDDDTDVHYDFSDINVEDLIMLQEDLCEDSSLSYDSITKNRQVYENDWVDYIKNQEIEPHHSELFWKVIAVMRLRESNNYSGDFDFGEDKIYLKDIPFKKLKKYAADQTMISAWFGYKKNPKSIPEDAEDFWRAVALVRQKMNGTYDCEGSGYDFSDYDPLIID